MRSLLTVLWRVLPMAAIVFQAGISGAWWAGQFVEPLPPAWGWFGAGLIGLAMFSGVELVVSGRRSGWVLVAVTALADCVMAWAYFGAGHGVEIALPLAMAPAAVTILAGWQAAQQERMAARPGVVAEERAVVAARERAAFEREQAALDREADRRAALIRARAEARAIGRTVAGTVAGTVSEATDRGGHGRTDDRTGADGDGQGRTAALQWLAAMDRAVKPAQVAGQFGASERTARRWLNSAGYGPNGDGLWHPQEVR